MCKLSAFVCVPGFLRLRLFFPGTCETPTRTCVSACSFVYVFPCMYLRVVLRVSMFQDASIRVRLLTSIYILVCTCVCTCVCFWGSVCAVRPTYHLGPTLWVGRRCLGLDRERGDSALTDGPETSTRGSVEVGLRGSKQVETQCSQQLGGEERLVGRAGSRRSR